MLTVWKNLRRTLSAFALARRGNVAITFALATLPIVGAVGFAVDYSHANSVKAAMQSALDSTALMLSKEAATDTNTQLQSNALKYFQALFTRAEAKSITVAATYSASAGSQIVVNGSAQVPTNFLGVIGYNNLTVNGSSTAKWGTSRLRVALVLDNTGSMADNGKITALISATNSLLTQLQTAVTNAGDVYVSIVPFVKDVNLGASNWNSNYIYWGTAAQDPSLTDNNSWDANNGSCSTGSYSPRSSCVSHSTCSISGYSTQSSCTGAGTCSISGKTSQSTCTGAGTCSNRRRNDSKQLHRQQGLLQISVYVQNELHEWRRNLGLWNVDGRSMDDRCLVGGDLDPQQPQHLERLRRGSRQFVHARHRQQLRYQRLFAEHEHQLFALPGRAI